MAVVLETSLGDITIDLYLQERPTSCKNFLKLCKIKYYNFSLFHNVRRNFIAQCGDPTATGRGGESIFAKLFGEQARYFEMENKPRIKHKKLGTVSMVNGGNDMHASQFFLTLAADLDYLDGVHTVFGEISEGFEVLEKLNETITDDDNVPYKDIRILHTVVLDDPFDDPAGLSDFIPDRSPEPTKEMMKSLRIGLDQEEDDEGKTEAEIEEQIKDKEATANAQLLEMLGDLPDAEVEAPDTVLFVCKLNPVTTSEDLEIIFSRFGNILSCEVIKDQKTGESLQYAFVEFEKPQECENAYFKMDNVLIDERRIHVDFSQSVSKVKWKGKGKGVEYAKDKEDSKAEFKIKDRSKKDNYELVLEDDELSDRLTSTKKKKKSKKHKRKSSSSDTESSDDDRRKKNKRKKNDEKQRSYSPEPRHSRKDRDRNDYRHYKERDSSYKYDRDRYKDSKGRDYHRDRRDHDSGRDRDRYRDDRRKDRRC